MTLKINMTWHWCRVDCLAAIMGLGAIAAVTLWPAHLAFAGGTDDSALADEIATHPRCGGRLGKLPAHPHIRVPVAANLSLPGIY